MKATSFTANILREFMKKHGAYKYRKKKVTDMTDDEVFQKCHWFCEENHLNTEKREFVDKALATYRYCSYLDEFIEESQCLNLQMITCTVHIKSRPLISRERSTKQIVKSVARNVNTAL